MLLTDNNSGDVKGRAVFNAKQSRLWTTKEATSSPTTLNDGIMITAAIDSK